MKAEHRTRGIPAPLRSWLLAVAALVQVLQQSPSQSWTPIGALPRNGPGVFDAALGRPVMFVPSADGASATVWSFDGAEWQEHAAAPVATFAIDGVAYDSVRQRTVLLSGASVYEWDGSRFTGPFAGPPLRNNGAIAFDAARGVTVLFGGRDALVNNGFPVLFDDTWTWNGTAWTQRSPAVRPPVRQRHSMTFDPVRSRVVLYGGGDNGGNRADTWEWDGSNWQQTTATNCGPRTGHALTFDPVSQRVVVFGGGGGQDLPAAPDTWDYDGAVWIFRTATSGPGPRGAATMIATPTGLLLVGGMPYGDNIRDSRTWRWSNGAWTLLPAAHSPMGYWGGVSQVVFDELRGELVHFNHARSYESTRPLEPETWLWNGTWRLAATTGPSLRIAYGLAFDSVRGVVVLHGGRDMTATDLADTWEWGGAAWSQRASAPVARYDHGMTYDPLRQRVVLFGGANLQSQQLGDTWLYDGTAWQSTPSGPSPRLNAMMCFDRARGVVVLVGGAALFAHPTDTWEWNGSWIQRQSSGAPTVAINHAFPVGLHDPATGAAVVCAQFALRRWNGATWTVMPGPALGGTTTPFTDTVRGRILAIDPIDVRLRAYGPTPANVSVGPAGCPILPPLLTAFGRPEVGGAITLATRANVPAVPCFLLLGLTPAAVNVGTCTLRVGTHLGTFASVANAARWSLTQFVVPADPALRGLSLVAQAACIEPGGLALGFQLSAQLNLRVGD